MHPRTSVPDQPQWPSSPAQSLSVDTVLRRNVSHTSMDVDQLVCQMTKMCHIRFDTPCMSHDCH